MSYQDQQRDNDRLRQRLDAGDRKRDRVAQEDVVIGDPRRLYLRSPNGTFFALSVSDTGVLTATNTGTDPR